jgi:ABC-type phosphate transport system substrate-binding protein
MTKLNLVGGLTAAVALSIGFAAQASTDILYAGGGTLAEHIYRDLYSAYGNNSSGQLCAGLTSDPASAYNCPTTSFNPNVSVLYVGVGSGNGLSAIVADSPATLTTGSRVPDPIPVVGSTLTGSYFGTGVGSSWTPALSPAYPKLSFIGSDNILSSAQVSSIASLGFGPAIQIPGIATAVSIPFTPTPGWNPKGKTITGASSNVQLSTNTICGIFTGKITDWSDSHIKADNANVQLGSGKITPVWRSDSSGTTFLFTNALLNQCGSTTNNLHKSTFPVPDKWLTDNSITNTPGTTSFLSGTKFFINVNSAGDLPSNFYVGGASGSSGLQLAVDKTVGAIGYLSPDFVKPVASGNDSNGNPVPAGANIQTYYTFANAKTAVYEPVTVNTTAAIVNTLTPPSFSGSPAPAANALNWGTAGINPTPTSTVAYPFGGFTWIDLYSCYASAADVAALVGPTTGTAGLFTWIYANGSLNNNTPLNIEEKDGFSPIPSAWLTAVNKLLLTNTPTKIGTPGQAKTACASVTKGA